MIEAALHSGWKELSGKLRAFIAHRVAPAEVDDVLQDTLLRIQRGLADLRANERFGPWVYRVTRSSIADHLRGKARAARRFGADAIDVSAGEREAGDEITPALGRCLAIFVAQLPSPYREAITVTDLEGLSHKQAAELVGISVSGMKSRVQRGRERLREMFERCCDLTQDVRGRVVACTPRRKAT